MPFQIHDPERRARLDTRAKPYFVRIADGLHLGYRKGQSVSRWVVRRMADGRYRTETVEGVEADDRAAADGVRLFSFQQMVDRLMSESSTRLHCSFCGKDHTQVAKLIAGPGVYICDACVGLCQLYLDHPQANGKLLLDDGKPVLRDGEPVFVPLSEEELQRNRELLAR